MELRPWHIPVVHVEPGQIDTDIVSPVMRTIGHVAPQAWAVDAWTALIARGGDLASIGRDLAVLSAVAAVLVGLAARRLRRRVVQPVGTR